MLYARLYWGIDFTDESYMVLNAYGPVLGTRPFVDEMMISQTASLLVTPFAYLFHLFNPAATGLVLFFRHIYFAGAISAMFIVYRCLRDKVSDEGRAFCAVVPLVFIPSCLPVPSYNSFVYFFGLGGQMFFLLGRSLGAGLLHSLAAYSHPAFLTGTAATAVVALWSRRPRDFRSYLLGSALFFVLVLALVVLFGGENLRQSFAFSTQPATFGGTGKLGMLWGELTGYWRRPLLVVIWASACAVTGLAGRLNWAVALGGFAATQDFIIPDEVSYGLHQRIACYVLFSAFLIVVDRRGWRDRENLNWLARLWLPAFLAGGSLAFVSSNGLLMAPLAWVGCLIYAFWRILRFQASALPVMRDWRRAVNYSAVVFILAQAQVFTLTHFYRDDGFSELDTQVSEGPFAGIYTTHQRRNFIADFTKSVATLDAGKTLFIYDMFAAGYLLAPARPNGPAFMSILPQWMPQMRAPLVQHFQDPAHWPDYVVEFFYFPFGARNIVNVNPRGRDPLGDPFKDFFMKTGRYAPLFDSEMYRVLRRTP